MDVSKHIIYGFLLGLVLLPLVGIINSIVIFLSSFLIDFDHYLYYVYQKKDLSLKNSYKWFKEKIKKFKKIEKNERENYKVSFLCFHGIESVLIFLLLGFFYSLFFYVAIGILFHLFLDYIEQAKFQKRIDKVSIIYDLYRFNTKLKRV